jgi:hypothetical protein
VLLLLGFIHAIIMSSCLPGFYPCSGRQNV